MFLFTCNLLVASMGYNPWYATLLKQNKVPPGMKWIHFLQINLIDECFTQRGSQDCRWLVFGLELQGTDGKAAALIYLNGSTGPHLLIGFSSDFFFGFFFFLQWLWLVESPQRLFRNFFLHFSTVLFPHFWSYLCCHCWRQRTGLDGTQNWPYRAFLVVLCSQNYFLLFTLE